ncbi:hypothetical protein Q1695_011721 [Nippostrongylus brasiliensis]|nr:hypothetical protein Q1695_011721 [Nippostrongylus brasiliensis]
MVVSSTDYDVDKSVEERVREMQNQVGTLSVLTTVTLLLALLMVVLYILEMICSSRNGEKSTRQQLPTAVVIQPKEDEDKAKKKAKAEQSEECRHNANRFFPSKTKMLDVDLKSPENEAAEKKQLKKKLEEARGQPEVLSVPLGAPPTYAESKKDVVLATGTTTPTPSTTAPKKSTTSTSDSAQAEPIIAVSTPAPPIGGKAEPQAAPGATPATPQQAVPPQPQAAPAAPSPTVSATQDSTATTNTTTAGAAVPAQPPPLTQLKTTTKQPIPPRPTIPPRKSAPAFPVPAKPPTKYVRTPKRTGSNSMSMSQSAGWPQPAPVPRNPTQPGSADSSAAPGAAASSKGSKQSFAQMRLK